MKLSQSNPSNQSLGFCDSEGKEWSYCLPHLLEMQLRAGANPRIRLLFSTEYVVIKARNLPAVWADLVQGEPDLQGRSAQYGITSIKAHPYRDGDA